VARARRSRRSRAVAVTRVVTAHEGRAQFAVWRVHGRNVGVFAGTGLVDRRGAGGAELGRGAVEGRRQRGEGSVGRGARGRRDVAVLPRAQLGGQEGGEAGGAVGGNRQVRVWMVVSGVEGFTWRTETPSELLSVQALVIKQKHTTPKQVHIYKRETFPS